MLWFRHSHDLRNSPAMKQIQRRLGDEGFAAAIRLIEVLTYRCGSGKTFNPTLTLAPPTSFAWLAREICTPYDEDDNCQQSLTDFINEAQLAGLITMDTVDGIEWVAPPPGGDAWQEKPVKHFRIRLTEFTEFTDVWTARVLDGRPGAHSTKV